MRIRNVIGGTVLGIATLFMTAPGAFATESASIGFIPNGPVKPGQTVDIIGACTAPGFKSAKLHSTVLDSPDLFGKEDGNGSKAIHAVATVRKDAKNGKHEVWYMCGKIKVTSHITVTGGVAPKPKTAPKPSGQVVATPKGSADTGGGAIEAETVATPEVETVAAPVQPEGVNYGVLGLGGAGLLATAGVGVLAYRKLRRES
jgi:hypothetical protein